MRLFVGLPIEEEAGARLFKESETFLKPKGFRLTPAANLHITLRFLGELGDVQREAVKQAARETAARHKTFSAVFSCVKGFPAENRAKVAWFGLSGGSKETSVIFAGLEESLRQKGFARELKPYVPHVTAGRSKKETDILDLSLNEKFEIKSRVKSLLLYGSELTENGAVYETIASYGLGEK